MEVTDEMVKAAVQAAIECDSNSLRDQMRAALEAALPSGVRDDEIDLLTRERNEARRFGIERSRKVRELEVRVAELEGALEPFAKYEVGSIAVVGSEANLPVHYKINVEGWHPKFDDFRRARIALRTNGGGSNEA